MRLSNLEPEDVTNFKKKASPFGTEHAHCGRPFNFFLRLLCAVFILLMWCEVTISIHMWGLHRSQSVPSARSLHCQQGFCLCHTSVQNNKQDLQQYLRQRQILKAFSKVVKGLKPLILFRAGASKHLMANNYTLCGLVHGPPLQK